MNTIESRNKALNKLEILRLKGEELGRGFSQPEDFIAWRNSLKADIETVVAITYHLIGTEGLLNVVKQVKILTGLGLREAKDAVDAYVEKYS